MKKERDVRLYLDDILEAIDKIERYTKGLNLNSSGKTIKPVMPSSGIFQLLGRLSRIFLQLL